MTPEEFIDQAAHAMRTGSVQWTEDGSMVLDGWLYSVYTGSDGGILMIPDMEWAR